VTRSARTVLDMSARVARVVALAGLVVAAVGLLVGLLPLTVDGSSCGSALHESSDARVDDFASILGGGQLDDADRGSRCDDKRSTVRLVAVPLLVLGGAGVIVGGIALAATTAPGRPRT
jgi:hypothetical protein